jgi:hypothetical protein
MPLVKDHPGGHEAPYWAALRLLGWAGDHRPSSADDSSSVAQGAEEYLRVVRRLEAEGRPDQAYMVLQAQKARTSGA